MQQAGNKSVEYYKNLFAGMKSIRSNIESIWTDIDRYVYGFTGSYDSNPVRGQFTYENVYDHTAFNANTNATNALVGILWQQGGRSIKISPAEELEGDAEVSEWFKDSSEKFVSVLDDPNSRLVSSLTEYMESGLSHGSAAVGVFRSSASPLMYKPFNVRSLFFQENEDGIIDSVALRSWIPAYQVVERYGEENVSPKTLQDSQSPTQRNDEIEIIQFIHPNNGEDVAEKPFLSIHIDMQNNHVMKDSFYEDLPVKVGRIQKTSFEVYGRCPAINVLSNIKRLNSVMGDTYENIEKLGRPSLGLFSDATVGQGVIDMSAGSVNVFNTQATDGNPVFPISDVGDIQPSFVMIERLQTSINEAYHIDKLITMLNESIETATQAVIIDRIRNTSLGALLARQINELFTPLIETSFNTLFNDGYFGVIEGSDKFNIDSVKQQLTGEPIEIKTIPDKIAKLYQEGKAIYKVEYLTPASRMLASEEANNIVEASRVATEFAQVNPASLDNIEGDDSLRKFYSLKGLNDLLVPESDVQEIRDRRQQMQEAQAQAEAEAQQVATAAQAATIEGQAQ